MNNDGPPPRLSEKVRKKVKNLPGRGREELVRSGGLRDTAHGIFRRWFRKVWESRGGGLYALGFALTFLYLEIMELITDDIPQLLSINLLSNQLFGFLVQFVVDTVKNMLLAFMWPVGMIQWQWPVGILCLVAGYTVFPWIIQKPLENWLFEGQVPPPKAKKPGKSKSKDDGS